MSTQIANARRPRTDTQSALYYLPIGLFGSVMGLASLSIAWRLASDATIARGTGGADAGGEGAARLAIRQWWHEANRRAGDALQTRLAPNQNPGSRGPSK